VVIDLVRGRTPPFNPTEVTREYAFLCRQYRIGKIRSDAYAAEWCSSAWRDAGVGLEQSELKKSDLFIEGLPHFTRGVVSIPDHKPLIHELRLLERRTSVAGKDAVGHPRGERERDDLANALFGCLYAVAGQPSVLECWKKFGDALGPIGQPGTLPQSAVLYQHDPIYRASFRF
jgi:hypothetical protein